MQFRCPTCDRLMACPDGLAGTKGACPNCGQKLLVPTPPKAMPSPTNKTMLGKLESLPGEDVPMAQYAPVVLAAAPVAILSAPSTVSVVTVRMLGPGMTRKFKTTRRRDAIADAIADAFDGFGLRIDKRSGEIAGELRQAYQPITYCHVNGTIRLRDGEIVIDVAASCGFPWWVILIFLFVPIWPLWVFGGLFVFFMTQKEGPRCLTSAFEEARQELAEE